MPALMDSAKAGRLVGRHRNGQGIVVVGREADGGNQVVHGGIPYEKSRIDCRNVESRISRASHAVSVLGFIMFSVIC